MRQRPTRQQLYCFLFIISCAPSELLSARKVLFDPVNRIVSAIGARYIRRVLGMLTPCVDCRLSDLLSVRPPRSREPYLSPPTQQAAQVGPTRRTRGHRRSAPFLVP